MVLVLYFRSNLPYLPLLDGLISVLMVIRMRILVFTGKGGVGQNNGCRRNGATALRCSDLGQRTLVMSTDATRSLSDSLEVDVKGDPTIIKDNLWAQETELAKVINNQWETIWQWLSALLAWKGFRDVVADEIAFLPGMEELANLL